METLGVTATPYMTLLALSVVLLVFHVLLQGVLSTRARSRLECRSAGQGGKPTGKFAGRAARASKNFQETYPAFVGLLLGVAFAGDDASSWGLVGGWIWFAARIVYVPLYLAGIPYFRSFVWLISLFGLLAMTIALFR